MDLHLGRAVGAVDAAGLARLFAHDVEGEGAVALDITLVPLGGCGLDAAFGIVTRETLLELVFVEGNVQEGAELLDHPGERAVDKAFLWFHPAKIAVGAGEGNLVDIATSHEGWIVGLTEFVDGEGMECESYI